MEKYKPIRQLMADGEFSKALDHLARILQKNPNDKEAKQLEYTCREMVHIQNACNEETEQKSAISVEEYVAVHFRRTVKALCHWAFFLLNKLPLQWQQKLKADRFRVWEIHFTLDSDSQKDWLWELLFWDTKRRIIVFTSLITLILLCVLLFVLLAFGGCDRSNPSGEKEFSITIKQAYDGDANAQFLTGKNFYYGKTVKKDIKQAVFWLTRSARAGNAQAAGLLQKILVEQDIRVHEGQYIWKKNEKNSSGITK